VVDQFLANSEEIPLLNKMWYAGNMFNTSENLTMDRKDVGGKRIS